MPQISVIVPVYKVEPYIRRCVDSILEQTFRDFELILVDDGSPDNCPAICDEYAAKDSRVRVIHQENGGLSAARNNGTSAARTEWVLFVDSDDFIHHQMFEILWQGVDGTGAKISMCNYRKVSNTEEITETEVDKAMSIAQVDTEFVLKYMCGQTHDTYFWYVCCKLVWREIVLSCPMPIGRMYEDMFVASQWCDMAGCVAYTRLQLYYYRFNPESLLNRAYNIRQIDVVDAMQSVLRYWEGKNEPLIAEKLRKRYFNVLKLHCRDAYYILKDKKTASRLRKDLRKMYYRYGRTFDLSRKDHLFVMEGLHPVLMQFYWWGVALKNKLRG